MTGEVAFSEFTLYRVVHSLEPTERDFWSYERLGKPLLDPKNEESWKAVSCWRTPQQAAKRCGDAFGWYIAKITFSTSGGSHAVRLGKRHADVLLEPDFLVRCVVRVVHKDDVKLLLEDARESQQFD